MVNDLYIKNKTNISGYSNGKYFKINDLSKVPDIFDLGEFIGEGRIFKVDGKNYFHLIHNKDRIILPGYLVTGIVPTGYITVDKHNAILSKIANQRHKYLVKKKLAIGAVGLALVGAVAGMSAFITLNDNASDDLNEESTINVVAVSELSLGEIKADELASKYDNIPLNEDVSEEVINGETVDDGIFMDIPQGIEGSLVGSKFFDNDFIDIYNVGMNTDIESYIVKYSTLYNIDIDIMNAICLSESKFNHYDYLHNGEYKNDVGYGAMQLELSALIGGSVTATDINGVKETIVVTHELVNDLESNVKIAAMLLNYYTNRYDNPLIAIMAYNTGSGPIGLICSEIAFQKYGVVNDETVPMVYRDSFTDHELLGEIVNHVNAFCTSPNEYIGSISQEAINANSGTVASLINRTSYGDKEYFVHILSSMTSPIKSHNDVVIDLSDFHPTYLNEVVESTKTQ